MGSFSRAVKDSAKLRLAISGPAGSGKTYTALLLASQLAGPDGRVALIDTEHGSASKYADLFGGFFTANMKPPYSPARFVAGIRAAEAEGFDVIVIDSISHEWNGSGGVLSMVEDAAARMKTTNKFAAWRDVTPEHDKLIEAITGSSSHVIATMRSKTEYVLDVDDRGRKSVTKRGMSPIQRDGFEYEFDILLDMDADNVGVVTKSRCPQLTNAVFSPPTAELAKTIRAWLTGGPVDTGDEWGDQFAVEDLDDTKPPEGVRRPHGGGTAKVSKPTKPVQEPPRKRSRDEHEDVRVGTDEEMAKQAFLNTPDSTDGWVNAWSTDRDYRLANAWGKERLHVGQPGGMVSNHFENGWKKMFQTDENGSKNPMVFLTTWRRWVNRHVEETKTDPAIQVPDIGNQFDFDVEDIPF